MANGHRATVYELRALHLEARRTVALYAVALVVEHADERQTALDFGAGCDAPMARSERAATSRSGVHVIDCDALLEAGEREIGGAA